MQGITKNGHEYSINQYHGKYMGAIDTGNGSAYEYETEEEPTEEWLEAFLQVRLEQEQTNELLDERIDEILSE